MNKCAETNSSLKHVSSALFYSAKWMYKGNFMKELPSMKPAWNLHSRNQVSFLEYKKIYCWITNLLYGHCNRFTIV